MKYCTAAAVHVHSSQLRARSSRLIRGSSRLSLIQKNTSKRPDRHSDVRNTPYNVWLDRGIRPSGIKNARIMGRGFQEEKH